MEPTAGGRGVAWFLLIALGAANATGRALDLHARFWWFDRVLHARTISAAMVWPTVFVRRRALRGGRGRDALLARVIAGVGLAIGAPWEVAEWGVDRIAPGDVIKGRHDTMVDIVMDTSGAFGAGLASLAFLRPRGGTRPPSAATSPAAPGAP